MEWFKRKSTKTLSVPKIKFICEKTGDAEEELKNRLRSFLRKDSRVMAAYLVMVQYECVEGFPVALCLVRLGGSYMDIVTNTAVVFAELFSSHEHLDIVVLNKSQIGEIEKTCTAFYTRCA